VRIIGGEFRGRRLRSPKGRTTRPTPDRVREALFSILADRVAGARVAELFGGTGSLGLEALSRGAAHATFFEIDRGARSCLLENIRALCVADRCTVHARSAFDLPRLRPEPGELDLVFADPPFRMVENAADRSRLGVLLALVPLAPEGLLLLEHRAGALGSFVPGGLILDRVREWGSTGVAFFRRGDGRAPIPPDGDFA
jgi:16S rRNA (guanine(966)-N(2))-methyltransferase RsmD